MSACDRGRTAVGEAEAAAFGGTDLETEGAVAALAARADAVTSGTWWTSAGGPPVLVSEARRSARSSSARGDRTVEVRLAPGQRDLATLAHELAHALAGVDRGHDERFRAASVDIVAVLAGPSTASTLAAAFAALGLDVAERPWPPPCRVAGDGFVVL